MRATVDMELGPRFSHDDKNKVLEEVLSDLAAGKLEELSAEHASEEAFQMALHVLLLKRCQHLMLDRYRAQLEPLLATDEEVAAGLADIKENGGFELHEFIGELEELVRDGDHAGK